jgi:hypothetical protein
MRVIPSEAGTAERHLRLQLRRQAQVQVGIPVARGCNAP